MASYNTSDVGLFDQDEDYKLELDGGVEDESLLEDHNPANFTITAYGADYPVDTYLSRLKSEAFFIPPFQRKFVWSQRHASRFIESLLMGLPTPGIFLYREAKTNKHLVVDGQQRLRTLQFFFRGLFLEKQFRLLGVRNEWNGKTFEDLDISDQLKLGDSIIHATIFHQDLPKDSQKSLYFVFERINSGGIRLSAQEIRNCINEGSLLALIRKLNDLGSWRSIFGQKLNPRLKDQELILRFLAMIDRGAEYERPMKEFLNNYATDMQEAGSEHLEMLGKAFIVSIDLCCLAKGKDAFRPSGTLNAAVFEAVMVGVWNRLNGRSAIAPTAIEVATAYDMLVKDPSFLRACERATADAETVKLRQRLAIDAFCENVS